MKYIKAFLLKYSVQVHSLLIVWNLFLTSWATKQSVTVYGFRIDASTTISYIQSHLHLPTWTIAVSTLILNFLVFYNNFKTQQAKCLEAKKTLGLHDDPIDNEALKQLQKKETSLVR